MSKLAVFSLRGIRESNTARTINFQGYETQDGFSAGPRGFSSPELFSGLHHEGSRSLKKSPINARV